MEPHIDDASVPEKNQLLSVGEYEQHQHTYRFVLRPRGWFPKLLGMLLASALFGLIFVFSLLLFALLAGVALVMLVYLWWVRRRKRRR